MALFYFNENSPARKAGYSEEQNTVVLIEATDFMLKTFQSSIFMVHSQIVTLVV